MHPAMAKKVESARKKGSGVRLVMSPDEIIKTGPMLLSGNGRMSGCGWFSDAWSWLKEKVPQAVSWAVENVPKAYNWAKENVIDTPFYQENIRPVVHSKVFDKIEGLPYANLSVPAAEWAAKETGAFGMKKPKPKGGRICQQRQKKPTGGSFKNVGY
jgi:hypothetical protein